MTTVREHELKLHVLHFALNISQQITICLDVTEMFNINICKHLKCHLFLMVAFISYCTKLSLFTKKTFTIMVTILPIRLTASFTGQPG